MVFIDISFFIFNQLLFSTLQVEASRNRKVLQLNDIDIVPNFDCDENCQGRIERALPIAIIGELCLQFSVLVEVFHGWGSRGHDLFDCQSTRLSRGQFSVRS